MGMKTCDSVKQCFGHNCRVRFAVLVRADFPRRSHLSMLIELYTVNHLNEVLREFFHDSGKLPFNCTIKFDLVFGECFILYCL